MLRSEAFARGMQGLMVRNEAGLIVPMSFSDSQKHLWKYVAPKLDDHDRLWFIVLKGRQVYATTFFQALTFMLTIERANVNSLVIAQDLDSATDIFTKAKTFYDYLPLPKMKPSKVKELVFDLRGGSSRFKVVSAGIASKGRGTTQTCVHCSEVAFWQHPEVLTGLFQAMPDLGDTLWVLESTANGIAGQGSLFYDQWKAAISGRSKLTPIFIPWFLMPKYRELPAVPADEWDEEEKLLVEAFAELGLDGASLRWRRNTIETKLSGLLEMFHQEYPSTAEEAFISSGLPAFDPMGILRQQPNLSPAKARMTLNSGGKLTADRNGELFVWKEPIPGHQYAIGVDTSEGHKGGDYTCAQVIDMDDLEQVALVHGLLQPYEFSRLLNVIGRWYNTAIVNIECKSTGWAVQDYMMRVLNYPRFHPWKGKSDHYQTTPSRLWGWDTNVYSRPLLIEAGRRALNKALLKVRDSATLDEIKLFSRQDNGKYEAETGHDDRVLALLLALRTREENYSPIRASLLSTPEISAPDQMGVRIIEAMDPSTRGLRKIHTTLKKRAQKAVKDWMAL